MQIASEGCVHPLKLCNVVFPVIGAMLSLSLCIFPAQSKTATSTLKIADLVSVLVFH